MMTPAAASSSRPRASAAILCRPRCGGPEPGNRAAPNQGIISAAHGHASGTTVLRFARAISDRHARLTCMHALSAGRKHTTFGIMWVTFGHLRPSGHIVPDHAGDRGAVFLLLAPHDHPAYQACM
jgi:hypothetical protein